MGDIARIGSGADEPVSGKPQALKSPIYQAYRRNGQGAIFEVT
jgi:hypothetical protein